MASLLYGISILEIVVPKSLIARTLSVLCLSFSFIGSAAADEAVAMPALAPPKLIERKVLFGNPERYQGRLSPNGELMSFRAPLDGVMNLWVGERGDFDSVRAITDDTGRGIPSHFWALDSEHVLYIRDEGGDENWHLYSVELESGDIVDLTPFDGVQAQMVAQDEHHPGVAIVGMNDRDPRWHDIYSVELSSGDRTLLLQNDRFTSVFVDNDLRVRVGMEANDSGGYDVYILRGEEWQDLLEIPFEDSLTSSIIGFDGSNEAVYMLDSRGRDKAALVRVDLSDGSLELIAESDKVDIAGVVMDPKTHEPVAYSEYYIKKQYYAVDEAMEPVVAVLNEQLTGSSQVLAQTLDGRYWTIHTDAGGESPVYVAFDTKERKFEELFVTNPDLAGYDLAAMHGVVIESRDGMDMVSYLSLPVESDPDGDGRPDAPVPMVMYVHGGPWARDLFGYSGDVQWLTNRGYAVLQVNYRGSTGFGKDFINAGNKEWARAMHNDLLDAKAWAVKEGITTLDEVAIMGYSYGGYATLVGLTFTPTEFACGVDIVGPSNLQTLIESVPPYWESLLANFSRAIGDHRTEEGQALLKARSPLTYADRIEKPLLIGQGANDPRVKQAESDQIVEAMNEREIPVTYVLYPDEGHGFQKPENNFSFYAVADSFLAQCLGGRFEPVGDDFENSSIDILSGAKYIPGIGADD